MQESVSIAMPIGFLQVELGLKWTREASAQTGDNSRYNDAKEPLQVRPNNNMNSRSSPQSSYVLTTLDDC